MRTIAFAAIVASAAAFSPMMSMETGRRQVVQAGAAAAVAAPLLRSAPAEAKYSPNSRAPVITILDHRGCQAHSNKDYKGSLSNSEDDEMCVKLEYPVIKTSVDKAASQLLESISFKAKGIDGPYIARIN